MSCDNHRESIMQRLNVYTCQNNFISRFSSWGVVRFLTMGIKICLTLLSLKQPIDTEGQCIVFTYFLIF